MYAIKFVGAYKTGNYLTSFRGRGGGFGEGFQHLAQHFFRMSDNTSSSDLDGRVPWAF